MQGQEHAMSTSPKERSARPHPVPRLHSLEEILPKVELLEDDLPTPPSPEELAEILPNVELLESDGVPLDSDWHRLAIDLLVESILWRHRPRDDFYVGGNMFVYYSVEQAETLSYRGPDFFYVEGVPREPLRRYWAVWKEQGKYPDVIIELLSPTTAKGDLTEKKEIYEQIFRTRNYYCYDPVKCSLLGWEMRNSHYIELQPNERGHLASTKLGLWLGPWEGVYQTRLAVWLRFFDAEGNLVLIQSEEERLQAEKEKRRAEQQKLLAEQEKQRAEQEKARAEQERQRADAAEAELARLRALLAAQGMEDSTGPQS
jgi:Uma2 family endonuclease